MKIDLGRRGRYRQDARTRNRSVPKRNKKRAATEPLPHGYVPPTTLARPPPTMAEFQPEPTRQTRTRQSPTTRDTEWGKDKIRQIAWPKDPNWAALYHTKTTQRDERHEP